MSVPSVAALKKHFGREILALTGNREGAKRLHSLLLRMSNRFAKGLRPQREVSIESAEMIGGGMWAEMSGASDFVAFVDVGTELRWTLVAVRGGAIEIADWTKFRKRHGL